ncbi:MAG: hypothetical protein J5521_03210 [Lachnospiraceae bacterium]|nr:hypothetical protein [Lachnospiraceae bacterium]MBR4414405.1 hypothetical protein [Aeriscardovia sp.]
MNQSNTMALSDTTLNLLLDNAEESLKKAILLSAEVGLRLNEICALKYSNIKNDHIEVTHVAKNRMYNWEDEEIMTEHRTEHISQEIKKLLGDGEPESYVTTLTPSQIVVKFRRLNESLNLPFRFNDLRHYHVRKILYT